MPRLAWATDIHLEFCQDTQIEALCQQITAAAPDALLLGGDIGQADTLRPFLQRLEGAVPCPIYFVLGNHDFYRAGIVQVRHQVVELTRESPRLQWLPSARVVALSSQTALVGVDGWADARYGDFFGSPVQLNDYLLIRELAFLDPHERYRRLNELGDAEAMLLDVLVRQALASHHLVVVLTHVPPFAEAAWHEGKQSDAEWLPHFSSKAAGDVLLAAAHEHPDGEILVLCGHTHGAGVVQVRSNLRLMTGGAEYGRPVIQDVILIP
jgi:predicted MPP superfamily phosphohydrolase